MIVLHPPSPRLRRGRPATLRLRRAGRFAKPSGTQTARHQTEETSRTQPFAARRVERPEKQRQPARRRRYYNALRKLLDFAAFGRDHQLHQLFRDLWLEALGVALARADDVSDDAAVLAFGILHDLSGAGPGQMSPRIGARILAGWIVDVASFCIGDIREANARAAAVFVGPR